MHTYVLTASTVVYKSVCINEPPVVNIGRLEDVTTGAPVVKVAFYAGVAFSATVS